MLTQCILAVCAVLYIGTCAALCDLPADLPADTQWADGNYEGCILTGERHSKDAEGRSSCTSIVAPTLNVASTPLLLDLVGTIEDGDRCTIQCVAGQAQDAGGTYVYICTGTELITPTPTCTGAQQHFACPHTTAFACAVWADLDRLSF